MRKELPLVARLGLALTVLFFFVLAIFFVASSGDDGVPTAPGPMSPTPTQTEQPRA